MGVTIIGVPVCGNCVEGMFCEKNGAILLRGDKSKLRRGAYLVDVYACSCGNRVIESVRGSAPRYLTSDEIRAESDTIGKKWVFEAGHD